MKKKPNSVIAKVWNWDKKWQVKWYEDGAAKGAMQRFNGYDPDYLEYVGRLKTEKYTQPQESFFYFEATPSEKARGNRDRSHRPFRTYFSPAKSGTPPR
mgnify:CR=1 FL=1